MNEITVRRITGADIGSLIDRLADLRISIFRDFPYLYDGSRAYESWYLGTFAAIDGAVVIGAFDGERLIGAATAAPLAGEHAEFRDPYAAAGYDVSDIFYLSESVLQPDYRGRGLGHAFFDGREAAARDGGFRYASFCAVMRPDDHPRRPADYAPLDPFWAKRGYRKAEGVTATFSWQDIDEDGETAKPMQFWIREL